MDDNPWTGLMVICLVVIVIIVICCSPASAAECRLVGKPEPEEPDPEDIAYISRTIWGEVRGCCEEEQRAQAWCILNRVDDPRFPDTVLGVITQRSQFFGYSPTNPVWDSLYDVAYDCLVDWHDGEERVLEPEFCFFTGNGRINVFTTEWGGGEEWAED